MKPGTLVELSAYGRNLKWIRASYNAWAFSDYAIVLEDMWGYPHNLHIAFYRKKDGKVFKRLLPRKAFRKAKVSK